MKVLKVNSLKGTERDVKFTGGNSLRPIIKSDNMGFTVCKTFIKKGGPYHWHYKKHLESCYCISGKGVLKNLENSMQYTIEEDSIYILDKNDNHTFEAITDVVLISVFNPPLRGDEKHNKNGVYE